MRWKCGLCFDPADATGDGRNRQMSQVCGGPRLPWDCAAVLIHAWKGSGPLGEMISFLNECEKLEVIIPRKDFSLSCF